MLKISSQIIVEAKAAAEGLFEGAAFLLLPSRALVRANGRRVQHEPLQVRLLQGLKDACPDAFLGSAVEALIGGVPMTVALTGLP